MNELIRSAVAVKDGKVVTTSLKIAEVFGKQHKNVLKAIRDMECPAEAIVAARSFCRFATPQRIFTAKRYAKPLGVSWKNIIEE